MNITELIAALEAADEGSRALDIAIALVVRFDYKKNRALREPFYTTSFEAALTLIPSDKDYEVSINGTADGKTFTCVGIKFWPLGDGGSRHAWHNRDGNKLRPAHAMCIAALKVRAALGEFA